MIILYEHPLSPYAQKNKIALFEKGVAFEARMPTAIGSGQAGGDFLKASPRGEVPALIDGDTRIFESTIIQEYIEEKWPAPRLMPKDPAARARVRMIEDVIDTHYEAINWGMGEIKFFRRAVGRLADSMIGKAREQTEKFQAWLASALCTRDWLTADTGGQAFFGAADIAVVPHLNLSVVHGFDPPSGSPLGKWLARANERPSVGKAREAAMASVTAMPQVHQAIESGLFRREYRDHRLEWMIKSGGLEIVAEGLKKKNIRFADDFMMA